MCQFLVSLISPVRSDLFSVPYCSYLAMHNIELKRWNNLALIAELSAMRKDIDNVHKHLKKLSSGGMLFFHCL